MKRICCIFLIFILLFTACGKKEVVPEEPIVPEEPTIIQTESSILTAQRAFVYDCTAERYIYLQGDLKKKVYPASITKLFTAYVALTHLDADTYITVGDELDLVESGASVAGLKKGNTLTVEMLIKCLLLPSGGDAAYTLAINAGRKIADDYSLSPKDALLVFVNEMNSVAQTLELENTHFVTVDGFHDDDHYISLECYIKIAELALNNAVIADTVSQHRALIKFADGNSITVYNVNLLVNPNSEYYVENACGLKSGRTSAAGCNLLSAYEYGERRIVVGVFGCPEVSDRLEDSVLVIKTYNSLCRSFFEAITKKAESVDSASFI